jgi:hypothetical protein
MREARRKRRREQALAFERATPSKAKTVGRVAHASTFRLRPHSADRWRLRHRSYDTTAAYASTTSATIAAVTHTGLPPTTAANAAAALASTATYAIPTVISALVTPRTSSSAVAAASDATAAVASGASSSNAAYTAVAATTASVTTTATSTAAERHVELAPRAQHAVHGLLQAELLVERQCARAQAHALLRWLGRSHAPQRQRGELVQPERRRARRWLRVLRPGAVGGPSRRHDELRLRCRLRTGRFVRTVLRISLRGPRRLLLC